MERILYPLKFEPILKDKIWGGSRLRQVLSKSDASDKCGESWEVSGVPGDLSVVGEGWLKGNNLEEIIEIYMGDLVGEKVFEKFGKVFPLLIKFIDANDDLSIQVHPNDEVAKERHNSYGKTEMWYIVQAEKNASLIVGFNKELDKKEYLQKLQSERLMEIMNKVMIGAGDVYFMPAGRVHAIGAGTLLAEIQQTSDITYRIYDYEREDGSGKQRELHTDMAVDVIDFEYHENLKTVYQETIGSASEIVGCDYFNTNIITIETETKRDYSLLDSFVIYMCVEGALELEYGEGKVIMAKGETVLIPAELNAITLHPYGLAKILEVYIK